MNLNTLAADEADKGHLHHRLMDAGYSQTATVLIMWGWTAALALCGLLMVFMQGWIRWSMVIIAFALSVFIIVRTGVLRPVKVPCTFTGVLRPVKVHGYDTVGEERCASEAAADETTNSVDGNIDVSDNAEGKE